MYACIYVCMYVYTQNSVKLHNFQKIFLRISKMRIAHKQMNILLKTNMVFVEVVKPEKQ